MGTKSKCNVTSYDPTRMTYDEIMQCRTPPSPPQPRRYDAQVIDHPDTTVMPASPPPRRYGAQVIDEEPITTGYESMELDHYNDVEKMKYIARRQQLVNYLQGVAGCGGGGASKNNKKKGRNKNKDILFSNKDPNKLKYDDYYPSYDDDGSLSDEVYIVRQNWGYFSILFSLAQTVIMALMILKCGIAPLKINPMIGPYPDVLSEWGAKNSVLILEENEWYRLITPIMLHAGVIHLLCNIAVQLETGVFFEKEWGSARWLVIYLVSAIGSTILSVIAMPDALSVGSSGAVMGLFGGKLSEVVMRACERARTKQEKVGQQVRKEQCCAVSCSVVVIMLFSFIPYVDWAAHLGGLSAGIIIGVFIFACEIESIFWRILWSIVGMAATIVCFTMALDYMYSGAIEPMEELRDVCQYYMEALGAEGYECQCQRGEGGDH